MLSVSFPFIYLRHFRPDASERDKGDARRFINKCSLNQRNVLQIMPYLAAPLVHGNKKMAIERTWPDS